MTKPPPSQQSGDPYKRWCGICFAWMRERDGRCVQCGNAYMRGSAPAPSTGKGPES